MTNYKEHYIVDKNNPTIVDYNALDYEDQPSDRESKGNSIISYFFLFLCTSFNNLISLDRDTNNVAGNKDGRKRKILSDDYNTDAKQKKQMEFSTENGNNSLVPSERSQVMAMALGVEPKNNDDLFPEKMYSKITIFLVFFVINQTNIILEIPNSIKM